MMLGGPLKQCLRDLDSHCDALLSQVARLQRDNEELKSRMPTAHPHAPDSPHHPDKVAPAVGIESPAILRRPSDSEVDSKRERLAVESFSVKPPLNFPEADFANVVPDQPTSEESPQRWGFRTHVFTRTTKQLRDAEKVHSEALQQITGLAGARLGNLQIPNEDNERLNSLREFWMWLSKGFQCRKLAAGEPLTRLLTRSYLWQMLCMGAIIVNSCYLGIQADLSVQSGWNRIVGLEALELDRTPDIAFAAWFSFELLIRAADEGKSFVWGEDRYWNLLDVFTIVYSIVELAVRHVSNFSYLRVLRVFRLVRVVRLVRSLRVLRNLRTMLFSILHSLSSLMWAFFMMLLVQYLFSVVFSSAVATYLEELDVNEPAQVQKAQRIHDNFGGIYKSIVSLFAAISGGNDWMMYGQMMKTVGPGYFEVFAFYVFFSIVGLLNVVTGVFVDSAVCTRTEDEVVESYLEDHRVVIEEVKRIFKEGDADASGSMSFEDFAAHLDNPWVKAYLSGLNIDISDARIVFTLLDIDGDDKVSVDEFVDGAVKLKGTAKSMDMMLLMFDQLRYHIRFANACSILEDQTRELKELVAPGSTHNAPKQFMTVTGGQGGDELSYYHKRVTKSQPMPSLSPVLPGPS